MLATGEGENEGGHSGPSGVVGEGLGAILEIAGHLAKTALGRDGKLTPESSIHLALRSLEKRNELLEQIIREVCPFEADEKLWAAWLDGGASPFSPKATKSPVPGKEKPNAALVRTTDRVANRQKKVAKARDAVEAAKLDLEAAERELNAVQNYESAIVHWYVVQQLVSILSPIFAMGPAWTIMRTVSGYLPEEVAEFETGFMGGKDKEDALARLRTERAVGSEKMHEVMDFFSGITEFEEALRAAVQKVCKDFDKRRGELVADGRRARSKNNRDNEVHPKAQSDAAEILDGLKFARPVNQPDGPTPGVSRCPL